MAKKVYFCDELFVDIRKDRVAAIESKFGIELNEEASIAFSVPDDEPMFFSTVDFARMLSWQEILDASSDMCVDFATHGIIPLIDMGDNDYISYNALEQKWCRFNIVDEISFDRKDHLKEYF